MTTREPSIRNIVVGVDFSDRSDTAVKLAMNVARHAGARLHLIHVGVVPDFEVQDSRFLSAKEMQDLAVQSFRESRALLEEMRERLAGQGVEISHEILEGYPDTGICKAASELEADLVVVGSHGRTGLSHFFLGSVAERVARMCESPVLVARDGAGAGGFKKILVPTDFTEFAGLALDTAAVLAAKDATLDVFHAWQMPPGAVLHYGAPPATKRELDALRESIEARAREKGEELIERRKGSGLELRFLCAESSPPHGILHRLEEEGRYDLVVMGSHGRRGFRRWILGSVAETVVRHAGCSVLVAHGAGGA